MKAPLSSFSKLNTFSSICELRYYYDVISGRQPSTPAQERGTHVHEVLEYLVGYYAELGCWEKAAETTKKNPPEGKEDVDSVVDRMLPWVRRFTPTAVELWFEKVEWDGEEAPVRGKIDLVSKTTPVIKTGGYLSGEVLEEPCCVDYKTIGIKGQPKSFYDARRSLQLQLYCLATGSRNGIFISIPPRGQPVGALAKFTDADLNKAWRWLEQTLKIIDNRWERNEGWSLAAPGNMLCSEKFCNHWSRCLGKK